MRLPDLPDFSPKVDTTIGNSARRPNKTAYSHDSDQVRHHADDYPTPRGFVIPLLDRLALPRESKIWEPAAGGGHMVAALREQFNDVIGTDLHYSGDDFLTMATTPTVDWIITNPPYKHAEAFVRRGLALAPNMAMLMNTAFLEGVGRGLGLYQEHPPSLIAICMRRMRLPGGKSSTFSHAWLVWGGEMSGGTRFEWLHNYEDLEMPTGHREDVWA